MRAKFLIVPNRSFILSIKIFVLPWEKMPGGMTEIWLESKFNWIYDEGKLNAPSTIFVIRFELKSILTHCAMGKLKAQDGTVVILLEFKFTIATVARGKCNCDVIDVISFPARLI